MIGYLHRCHEKLAENLAYVQYPTIASKTDYVAAMTSELAYVMAAERLAKIEVPKRAQYLRVLVAELQRVASHCIWLGTWCMDMGGALGGAATIFLYCMRERELILDLFENYCGARLTLNCMRIGGQADDVNAAWDQKLHHFPRISILRGRVLPQALRGMLGAPSRIPRGPSDQLDGFVQRALASWK